MKEPSLSRPRKKPTSKLKLVCSFNGAFHVRPQSTKLRYIGGETRIISVDRTISFSKLHSKISDICPNVRSFILKCQLPVSGPDADDEMPLVLIASDEDVKCMVEEYDKLELYGKHARLWLFVCNSEIECDDKGSNIRAVKGNGEDSLRKIVLKQQQLLANQSKMETESACCGAKPEYEHPLIDLGGDNNNMWVFKGMGNAGLHPLNPRDGNLCVETNVVPQKWLMGRSGLHSWGAGTRTGSTGLSSVPLKETYNFGTGTVSVCNFNRENIMPWTMNNGPVKTHLGPLSCGSQGMGSHYPVKSSYVGDRAWNACQNGTSNFRFGVNNTRNQRSYPYSVRSHRNNMVEAGNHGDVRFDRKIPVGKCYLGIRHNSNISKGRQSVGLNNPNLLKTCPVFAEHALQGRVSMAASCLNKGSSCFDAQYSKEALREQGVPANLKHGNSNLEENHLVYHGTCDCVHNQAFLSHDPVKSPSSCVRMMNTWEDRLTCSNFETHEVPYQALYENFNGIPTKHEPICSNLENDKLLVDSLDDANIFGLSNNMDYANGTTLEGKRKTGNQKLQGGIASSMDLLYNLSLSSSKEIEPPHNSSISSSVVSDTLLKPQSKPSDAMDEGHLSECPTVDESNRETSSSSSQNAVKSRTDDIHGEETQKDPLPALSLEQKADIKKNHKCSKVFGGICNELTAFFTHLATGELQTIKNSDLEYIKELGSGTFGTVFYGKWKGSDVAIKRMKASCFTEDSVQEDRLVSDFWREAHMLGQLHHPNIVAFYGVVTDGPATNLATVTEYMVNGSLKQVLQRKDRTIDRRKRLLIAMDAAFGMEYLHEKNIVHFDLKSHNFLVNMRDPQRPVCKIGDLGLSKIKKKTLISGGVRGTIPWMAPELLNSKNNLVTEKIDVYSFGVVMWELLTGEEPYKNLHSEEIIAGIIKGTLRPEIPNWCDPTWRSLMERCWSSDPGSRPAFSEISKELRAMAANMNMK